MISLFKLIPKNSAGVLSSAPKHKEAAMYLMKKIHVLDKLFSGTSFSATGSEFNVNEPTAYVKHDVFK